MILTPGCNSLALRAIITLNGEVVKYCTYADDEQGVIIRYAILNDGLPTELLQLRETGIVQIIDPEDPQTIHDAYTRCDRG